MFNNKCFNISVEAIKTLLTFYIAMIVVITCTNKEIWITYFLMIILSKESEGQSMKLSEQV